MDSRFRDCWLLVEMQMMEIHRWRTSWITGRSINCVVLAAPSSSVCSYGFETLYHPDPICPRAADVPAISYSPPSYPTGVYRPHRFRALALASLDSTLELAILASDRVPDEEILATLSSPSWKRFPDLASLIRAALGRDSGCQKGCCFCRNVCKTGCSESKGRFLNILCPREPRERFARASRGLRDRVGTK